MRWSEQQTNIFDWFKAHSNTRGSLIVEAVAGSGKTTTIVEASKYIPQTHSAVFCAFNKSIATELQQRLPGNIESKTLNALGHRAVAQQFGRVRLDSYKTRNIIRDRLPQEAQPHIAALSSIVAKAKSHGMVPEMKGVTGLYKSTFERWATLMDRYQVETECDWGQFFEWADTTLKLGLDDTHCIDFDDQLYMTVAYNIPCKRYDWLIVDEAQDVSHVQRAMLRKHLKEGGRLIAVGDSRQAIYGFRGADSESLANIAADFSADTLPLHYTYRCPKAVVALAKQYCPELKCPDTAPEGEVITTIDYFNPANFTSTDMVLCRNWAPNIKAAYKLIAQRIPVRVAGRDIGHGLVTLVKQIAGKRIKDISDFEEGLVRWRDRESEKARQRGQDGLLNTIDDKFNSILAVIDATQAETVSDLSGEIEALFEGGAGVTFSTIHRAKGLEAQRVFILEPGLMPSKYATQEWMLEQEHNLMYVAYTRSLDKLYFIDVAALDEPKDQAA